MRSPGLILVLFTCRALSGASPGFEKSVQPVLNKTCAPCHNSGLTSGGLDVRTLASADSLAAEREQWEKILIKVRNGQMPPKGVPRSDAEIDGMVKYIESEFEKADRNRKPDPGRVTAHRLNRSEYANTIRDLLGVDFSGENDFPTDDSGAGFDNIGDVLTISPVLMEKYLAAAETIAARAIGADPLPKKPLHADYSTRNRNIRRIDAETIEAVHRLEWDGDYIIRIGMPGERGADGKPVMLGFWMDGKLIHSMQIETKPSGLVYFTPYSWEEMRLPLPAGDHTFRAGFIDDEYSKKLTQKELFDRKKNKILETIIFEGPFASTVEKASRRKILICDPNAGQACVEKIISTLARRAFRGQASKNDAAALMKIAAMARRDGQTPEQSIQLAIQAMLVSPRFLFRIERDPDPNDAYRSHPVSDLELASRLSYFLWSSMPDETLLRLAEAGKLRSPGTLDAQVKRMLADTRAAAFAENFAGQWLQTRNLNTVKPDPQRFPQWGPELRDAMKTETRMFFESVLRENRPISEFLDAKYTFLNEQLARHYGIAGVTGGDFRRVDLATGQRGGVLSQASVLTVSSYPTRTSPVVRGKFVLENILGTPPPPPPPEVPPLDEAAVGTSASLRQQLEKHRARAECASCHDIMDSLGFGLENYDAIGRWRTTDGRFPIDSRGGLPNGKTFDSPAEMRALLTGQLPQFARCLTEKTLMYALGRGLERYDASTVDEIDRKVAAAGYGYQSLILEIARSLPFQSRRGEGTQAAAAAQLLR